MRLTPIAKAFITLVLLAVVAYVTYHYFGADIKRWASGGKEPVATSPGKAGGKAGATNDTAADFGALSKAPADPGRKAKTNVTAVTVQGGKLTRPLIVGINTWAGHAPGIVANLGMEPGGKGLYKTKYDLDVRFVLLEDPAAKLAAFKKGDIDVMWDTVDSWAREASVLAEAGISAKAILMQDWSRGGDGIAALSSIKSVEDLKGKKIATTQFTPSHWLLLYLLSQSGLSPADRAGIEKNLMFTNDAPAAAAAFKAKKVDAAVTWEPDLSGAVKARGDEAHILVSTTAATHVIADCLVARQEVIDQAPETLRAFVHGWLDGIEEIRHDPATANVIVGKSLKLAPDEVAGMLSGLKLTPFADNAQFFGLSGGHAHFETLFNTAFIIWRKKGVVTKAVDARDYVDTRFLASLAGYYQGQKVVEPKLAAQAPSAKDRAIINKQISIHFTTNSDTLMPGSEFVLDSLGDTMVAFGNTYLRIEGNTDKRGRRAANVELSRKRAEAVKKYLVNNFKVDAARIQTIGHGPDKPVCAENSEECWQLNRRTDIKVVLATK
jgi:NitT/TauT family transport system substrate-binding protein